MNSLIGTDPKSILPHGPGKCLIDAYHWHEPKLGIVASYTPTAVDVAGHFGFFRGVDMVEAFSLAGGSCISFLESKKSAASPDKPHQEYIPMFLSIGEVNFRHYAREGETLISLAQIQSYKFRQMVSDGKMYKVPKGLDLNTYFENYAVNEFLKYELPEEFTLVAEFSGITGKAYKVDKLDNK